jgi:hypothetical protein
MHAWMSFFSWGSHGRGNKGRGNWNRGPRRPMFSIHFDVDSQELGQLFQAKIFNWIMQGSGPTQARKAFFPSSASPWYPCASSRLIVTRGPWKWWMERDCPYDSIPIAWLAIIYPYLLLCLLTPLSQLPPTHQCSPLMLEKGWKMRPTMPLTKETPLLFLPHPPMALTNPCLPGCIWWMIVPMWSWRLGLKAQRNQRKIQENRRVTTTIKEIFHLRVGNMAFEFLFYLLLMTIDFRNFWTSCFILDIWVIVFENNFKYHELNCQKWICWWESQGGVFLLNWLVCYDC